MDSLRLAPDLGNQASCSGGAPASESTCSKAALRRTPLLAPEAASSSTKFVTEKTGEPPSGSILQTVKPKSAVLGNEEAALLACLATLNHWDDEALAAQMGWSRSHLSNVLRPRKAITAKDRQRLIEGVGSVYDPFHDHPPVETSDGIKIHLPKGEDLSGPHPFECFGPWVTEIKFASLLDEPMRVVKTHCSIDRLVVMAQPKDLAVALLKQTLPPLQKAERKALRTLASRERRRQLPRIPGVLIDDRGHQVAIDWSTSEIDVHEPYNRSLRYKQNVELAIAGTDIVLAVLSHGPSRKPCDQHKRTRGDHLEEIECSGQGCPSWHFQKKEPERVRCGTCSYETHEFWKCESCLELNRCAECDALTAAQPGLRLEITGTAWRRGLANGLLDVLRAHFALPGSIEVKTIDIAIDVEAPFVSLVPFIHPEGPWRPKRVKVKRLPIGAMIFPTGMYLGSGARLMCIYDVLAAAKHFPAERGRRYELPEHARGAEHITRFELRLKVQKGQTTEEIVQKAVACFSSIAVADLRRADPTALHSPFMVLAKEHGIQSRRKLSVQKVRKAIGRPPARKNKPIPIVQKEEVAKLNAKDVKQLQKRKPVKPLPLDMAEVLLDRQSSRQRAHRLAEERVTTVRTVVVTELVLLAEKSGIRLGTIIKQWAPQLREFLDGLLASTTPTPEASSRAPWEFWMPSASAGTTPAILEEPRGGSARTAGDDPLRLPAPPGGLRWSRSPKAIVEAPTARDGPREVASGHRAHGAPMPWCRPTRDHEPHQLGDEIGLRVTGLGSGPEELDALLDQLLEAV